MFDHGRVILRIDPLLVNIANDNRVIRKNRFVASNIANNRVIRIDPLLVNIANNSKALLILVLFIGLLLRIVLWGRGKRLLPSRLLPYQIVINFD